MSLRQASRELFNRGKERLFQRVIVPGIDKIGRDKQDIAFAELECKGPLSGFSVSAPSAPGGAGGLAVCVLQRWAAATPATICARPRSTPLTQLAS
jgi:hypothetical protein